MTSYVYRYNRETSLYEVGFYHPDQTWEPDVNLTENCVVTPGIAAARVAFLNGGDGDFDRDEMDQLRQQVDALENKASDDRNDIDQLIQRVHALETKMAGTIETIRPTSHLPHVDGPRYLSSSKGTDQ